MALVLTMSKYWLTLVLKCKIFFESYMVVMRAGIQKRTIINKARTKKVNQVNHFSKYWIKLGQELTPKVLSGKVLTT